MVNPLEDVFLEVVETECVRRLGLLIFTVNFLVGRLLLLHFNILK